MSTTGGQGDGATGRPRIAVVMPAYNAEKTLERTLHDIPAGIADDIILVDDASRDGTPALARRLGITMHAMLRDRTEFVSA